MGVQELAASIISVQRKWQPCLCEWMRPPATAHGLVRGAKTGFCPCVDVLEQLAHCTIPGPGMQTKHDRVVPAES